MKLEIGIEGMSCQNCVRHATEALQGVKNVSSVKVSLEAKNASLEISEAIPESVFREVLDDAGGYTVTSIKKA